MNGHHSLHSILSEVCAATLGDDSRDGLFRLELVLVEALPDSDRFIGLSPCL